MRIYSLDRIADATLTADIFKLLKNFSAAEYFANYYGIYINDHKEKPQRVVIRANEHHNYIMTLPHHHTLADAEACAAIVLKLL